MTRNRSSVIIAAVAAAMLITASGARAANIVGSTGSDILFGTNKADRIRGDAGADLLFGKGQADQLFGDAGNDTILGGGGPDILDGGPNDDTIYDDDSIAGDRLRGREGNDTLFSIDGRADRVNCGAGSGDTAYVDRGTDIVRGCETVIRRGGDAGEFRVRIGSNSNDIIETGDVRNLIFARAGNDIVRAGGDDDVLLGGGGREILLGEDDDDVHIDDDTLPSDAHRPGDGRDVVFTADGARDSVDCSTDGDNGDDDVVYADGRDSVVDCGTVFRG